MREGEREGQGETERGRDTHPGQVRSSGGTWTNMLLGAETMVSDRRSEMRNFSDPETSLAGLKQRNATYAFLEMEDMPPPLPPTPPSSPPPACWNITTSHMKTSSSVLSVLMSAPPYCSTCADLPWSSDHLVTPFPFPFLSLSLSQQRCAGSFSDTWRCFCFHSLFGVSPKCMMLRVSFMVPLSADVCSVQAHVLYNNHQLFGSVIKIQRQHNEDSNDPRWPFDDRWMTCLSAWLPVWLAEETQSQMGLMTFRLICDPCVLSRWKVKGGSLVLTSH